MTTDIASLVSDNLDIWTTAVERKSGAGRGGGKRVNLHGADRLRALILNFAVRGKLAPQDGAEEPAAVFLKRLKVVPKAVTGDLPKGWATAPLTAFGAFIGGITPSKGVTRYWGQGVYWVSPKDMGGDIVDQSEDQITQFALDETSLQLVPVGSILMVARSGILRRKFPVAITQVSCTINQDMKALILKPEVDGRFLQLMLQGFQPRILTELVKRGMTVESLIFDDFVKANWPIPPLAEQKRIVAKVDELMALCDALEAESTAAMAAHQTLVEALLSTLTASTDPADLATNWSRLEAHFDTLFTTEAGVDALKQTILDLAVRGKLVEQNAEDEPASALLMKIIAANSKRVASGQSKAMRSNSAEPEGKNPFDLPSSWIWTSLDRLAFKLTDGAHHTPTYLDSGVPFLSVKDMSDGHLDFSETRFISEAQHAELYKRCDPEFGDLLITKVGTTGVPVIVDTDQPFSLFVSVALVKAPWKLLSVKFLRLMVDSPFVRKQSADGTQGIGNKNLVLRTIGAFRIPLPPLAEQHRIVTKVDELMALCDALKARIADAAVTQKQLANAVSERAAA